MFHENTFRFYRNTATESNMFSHFQEFLQPKKLSREGIMNYPNLANKKNVKSLARSLTGDDFEYTITNDPNTTIELTFLQLRRCFSIAPPPFHSPFPSVVSFHKIRPLLPISTRNTVPCILHFFFFFLSFPPPKWRQIFTS